MQSQAPAIKTPYKTLQDYNELVETLAKVEFSRLSSTHLIEFSELLNIGAFTVYTVLNSHNEKDINDSYMSTAIKWAIRNELRRRYRWYSAKSDRMRDGLNKLPKEEVREAVYETILSIDELAEAEKPKQIQDNDLNPEESFELRELQDGIKKAIKILPERQRKLIEGRFYKGKKLKELEEDFQVSSSRLSRIIQDALDKIKEELTIQELV